MNRIEANIAGTKIPLKVTEEEEVYVKKAIEEINARIRKYQTEFAQKDIQDCILMALLTYAVDHHKVQSRVVDDTSWNTLIDIQNQLQVLEAQSQD
jgi:cell division protein ZapA